MQLLAMDRLLSLPFGFIQSFPLQGSSPYLLHQQIDKKQQYTKRLRKRMRGKNNGMATLRSLSEE